MWDTKVVGKKKGDWKMCLWKFSPNNGLSEQKFRMKLLIFYQLTCQWISSASPQVLGRHVVPLIYGQ